ncbi:hypothetical protein F2Q69_00027817 [Brassica cretica]|uniref:Uncharacterized protein n=1 Tax=Brassica cretica TaxID=69181 RepID=A0A8S9RUD9_BRACR|nr:hypothetical protein F2Q69_00027817 [Brassica cretica]
MDIQELPRRIHTLGEEPPAVHSISYHTCWTLHTALKKALHDDEYEELNESKLGVFIKFQELGFDWASRLVHYMLGFQLDIKKKRLNSSTNYQKRYDANPQHFRSERMCFLDHLFSQQWRFNFKDFKDSEPDQNSLGRRLPGGAWNYYAGIIPSFCQSNKVWGRDINDIYAPVNYADSLDCYVNIDPQEAHNRL